MGEEELLEGRIPSSSMTPKEIVSPDLSQQSNAALLRPLKTTLLLRFQLCHPPLRALKESCLQAKIFFLPPNKLENVLKCYILARTKSGFAAVSSFLLLYL